MTSTRRDRITRDDIESKFRELQTEVDLMEDEARNYAGVVIVAVVVTVAVAAFVLGRRKGRKTRTFVEIRRL
jgi:hypothetical protein